MKKILVFPVKNEEWILEQSLTCASLWADHIITAYQDSYDKTLEILRKFPKVIIVENPATVHSSNVRKLLLEAARNFEGNNAIFSFDADEIPTSHMLSAEFNQKLENLQPGTALEMEWINLWRSPNHYRNDKSIWSNSWKDFGFIDDRKLEYKTLNIVSDHTTRIPSPEKQQHVRLEFPKVLHYQFVDWDRVMSKQAYYRLTEFEQSKKTFLGVLKINLKYFPSKDETGLHTSEVPQEWIGAYEKAGIDLQHLTVPKLTWFDREIIKRFKENTPAVYAPLDIWDVNWEQKRQLFGVDQGVIKDPRSPLEKLWEALLPVIYFIYSKLRS